MALPTVRLFTPPSASSYFLFGPRGTGKSTLLRTLYPDALWIDLLLPEVLRGYLAWPERLREWVAAHPESQKIVIDEVQKAPELLNVVHSMIEEKRGLQFALSGSNGRKLMRASANLLAGRAIKRVLHPFMASELNDDFHLDAALKNGLLPLIVNAHDPQEALRTYVHLYEEIQMEGFVRSLESFSRFLEIISFSHASLLNLSNISRECAIRRKTVENYLEILEDLLLSYRLPVFSKRAQRELSVHPKFYLFDAGVFRALRPKGFLDRPEEIEGAALEGLVAQHLKTWIDYSGHSYTLSFWRTRSGVEVDFVVYGEEGLWAIEVKNSRQVYSQDIRPLQAFKQDYPQAQCLLLYRGEEILKMGEILCFPCESFLKGLRPNESLLNGF